MFFGQPLKARLYSNFPRPFVAEYQLFKKYAVILAYSPDRDYKDTIRTVPFAPIRIGAARGY